MRYIISEKMLKESVRDLAKVSLRPYEQYGVTGSLHLDAAYGGFQLQEYDGPYGGVRNLTSGYVPKRELYSIVCGMIAGARMK